MASASAFVIVQQPRITEEYSLITIKTEKELSALFVAGQITGTILENMMWKIAPGMTGLELNAFAEKEIKSHGAIPAFKGYKNFPHSVCISINNELVHGIPSTRKFQKGDVVGLDFGVIYKQMHGDSAVTIVVGEASSEVSRFLTVCQQALENGLLQVRSGLRLGDVSSSIQAGLEGRGYGIVQNYGGHGIGRALHEEPDVPNIGLAGTRHLLRAGMALALEPMIAMGNPATIVGDDKWTVLIKDGSLGAQFEHTVYIDANGFPIVTTRRPSEKIKYSL
jgi:methionyl aminopeptidase